MTIEILIVLAITAVGGLVLASKILMGEKPPWLISIVHAALGAVAIVMLLLVVVEGNGTAQHTAALGLLVVAALGGFYLASIHFKGELARTAIVVVHAGLAVSGVLVFSSILLF